MTNAFDLLGVAAGGLAVLLGIVVLVEEHKGSPMMQRLGLGLLVFACFLVMVDGLGQTSIMGLDLEPSPFGGLFTLLLSFNWMCRLRALRRRRKE